MKRLLYILSLFCLCEFSYSQQTIFLFHTKGVKNGLSFNQTSSLLRDSRGFLWVGTFSGLNRFDGGHFNSFNARQDSNSFINNAILDLCEDKQGNIWGATHSGIFCYNVLQNKFINYIPPGYDYARAIYNIICDKNGNVWATGTWNILKFNKQQNKFEEIGPLTTVKDSLGHYSVRQNGMIEDPSGKGIWMATRMGLQYYNIAEDKFYNFRDNPGDSLFKAHNISAMSLSKTGNIWFYDNTEQVAVCFNPASHAILYRVSTYHIIPNANGQTLFEDSEHKLWFSTWNYKMAVIDYFSNSFTELQFKNDNPLSISADNFWDICEDEDNTLWLATSGGISQCNYKKNIYSLYPISDKVKEFAEGRLGTFSIDQRDNSWWIASDATPSVIHYSPETGNYVFYDFKKAIKNKNGKLPSYVYSIDFVNNQLYAQTHTGIWTINEATGQMKPFEKHFNGLPPLHLIYFVQDGNIFWFATPNGFIKWNQVTDEAKMIKVPGNMLPDSQQVAYGIVRIDKQHRPWFQTGFGWVGHVNEKDEIELNYFIKDKPKELSSYITSLQLDSKDNLWMSSFEAGIYKYNTQDKEIKLFDRIEGIGTNPGNITVDKEDRIWSAANSKFFCYKPETGSVTGYLLPLFEHVSNYSHSIQALPDNTVMAVFHKYLVRFFPDRMQLKPRISPPLLSSIKILGKERLLSNETSLVLEANENSVEFSFGSLINSEVFPYTFEYKLDGFDKSWHQSSNKTEALYSNLKPGNYTFHVKAISKNKTWETPERILYVKIKTPFYLATWFWILVGLFIITALVRLYRFRMNKQKEILTLENKAQILEKEKTQVMFDSLKQQLNPHFLFNSLTSLSGLIESDQKQAGNFLKQMSKIYRYILKSRENELVSLREETEMVQVYINLQKTRFKNGLHVNINIHEDDLSRKIPPVTLQNMVENAIKHNIIDIESPLVIAIYTEEDYLVVKNNLQKKNVVETSNRQGLASLQSLYRYLSERQMKIEETENEFIIRLPLI